MGRLKPDHKFTPDPAFQVPRCAVCGLPEGNRKHTAADVVVNGTTYGGQTPKEVIKILDEFHRSAHRHPGARLRLTYGDPDTGHAWGGEPDTGYIGRSTGTVKIPLVIHNRRSMGGGGVLDHCIVRIELAAGGHVLWQHPKYQPPKEG